MGEPTVGAHLTTQLEQIVAQISSDPVATLIALGELHDARIELLRWEPLQRRLEVHIDDLFSNFLGLPEYPGGKAGGFVATEVSRLTVTGDFVVRGLAIDSLGLEIVSPLLYRIDLRLSPAGQILVDCGKLHFVVR